MFSRPGKKLLIESDIEQDKEALLLQAHQEQVDSHKDRVLKATNIFLERTVTQEKICTLFVWHGAGD